MFRAVQDLKTQTSHQLSHQDYLHCSTVYQQNVDWRIKLQIFSTKPKKKTEGERIYYQTLRKINIPGVVNYEEI